jgi:excisionase family DNA binding protein
MPLHAPKDVLTTREAARLLGLSVSSVQRLVMDQALQAWVTPGGHRRISRHAVERFRDASSNNGSAAAAAPAEARPQAPASLKVLLVDDDAMQRAYLQTCLAQSGRDMTVSAAADASQALIQIERHRPDLVITDLAMQPFDGFHLVNALATEAEYAGISVLVVTGLPPDDPVLQQRLPDWVSVYSKPVAPQRLMGYVDALCSRLLRARSTWA